MSETQGTSGFGTLLQRGDGGIGAGTQASRTIGTSNQQIIIRAKKAGTAGNSKTCSIAVSGNNTAFALTVTENAITVVSATDGSAVATTTVNELLYQLMQDDTFAEHWEATRGAGNGTGVVVAASSAALSGGAEGAEVFTTIAEITSVGEIPMTRDFIDATHMQSPGGFKEYLPGLKDGGELPLELNFLPGNTTQQDLKADYDDGVRSHYRVIFTDSPPTTYGFSAYVANFSPNGAQIDDKLSLSVTLKITGEVAEV